MLKLNRMLKINNALRFGIPFVKSSCCLKANCLLHTPYSFN